MSNPQVAIIGRPNVGKSTLFNRIIGQRISITADTPGVTRDRILAHSSWNAKPFTLIDTGGLDLKSEEFITSRIREQSQLAIEIADVIIFVADGRTGPTNEEIEIAKILKKSNKPVILAANKIDNMQYGAEFYDFYKMGFDEVIAVSSIHGTGTGDLLDEVVRNFPVGDEEEEDDTIKVAIIGRPNVGKSSLLNAMAGEGRVVVSPISGTTTDSIDQIVEIDGKKYDFIDTAGIRKKSKITEDVEHYSYLRSVAAVDRAEVIILVINAEDLVINQDTRIAGIAHEEGKAVIIAVNKWDAIKKDTYTMKEYEEEIRTKLAFMSYAPTIFISAIDGTRLPKLVDLIDNVYESATKRLTTGVLNEVIGYATMMNQPPSDKGKRLKIYYATQVGVLPPAFVLFVNDKELFHFSYKRYIENQLREHFGFEGTPIHIMVREKDEDN